MAEGDLPGAIGALQDAMDGIKGTAAPIALASAFRMVGLALLQTEQPIAARRHLHFAYKLNSQDEQTALALSHSYRMAMASQVLKMDLILPNPPADQEWGKTYQQLRKLIDRGRWRTALQYLEVKLLSQFPGEPALLRTQAILATWLGQSEKAVEIWIALAKSSKLSVEEAIDAQLWAIALSEDDGSRLLDVRQISIPLRSMEDALTRLESSPQTQRLEAHFESNGEEPPPRALFVLTDRPIVPLNESMPIDEIPLALTELNVFGRQTDRPARIEFVSIDDGKDDEITKTLRQVLGDSADFEKTENNPFTTMSEMEWRLARRMFSPTRLDRSQSRHWQRREEEHAYLELWPNVPLRFLDQKSPLEATRDAKYQIALEALVASLELRDTFVGIDPSVISRLREKLGLREPAPIPPPADPSNQPTAAQRLRIRWDEASDPQLGEELMHNIATGFWSGFRRLAPELIRRPSLEGKLPFDKVYRMMASMTLDDDEALNYLRLGRKHVQSTGQPLGPWLVGEVEFRLERQIDEQFSELLEEIQTRHMHEPGVQARLRQIASMVEASLGGGAPESAAITEEGVEDPHAASEIWTPQSSAPSGSSKLWLPGSE